MIRIRATVDAKGTVVSAVATGPSADLAVAPCVADAVQAHARFPASTQQLQAFVYTYTL